MQSKSAGRSGALEPWRLILGDGSDDDAHLDITPVAGAVNMAVDEALLESVRSGGRPAVRLYTWQPACLSFGRNQSALGIYDRGKAAALGIDVVRRPTGGLAVLHDAELTYCVAAPAGMFGGPRAAYASINRALVAGLRLFGVDADQAAGIRARGPLSLAADPCFHEPAAGEVVARGRKLIGSAQRCDRGVVLQHGSILISGSQNRVNDLTISAAEPSAGDGSIALDEVIGGKPHVVDLVGAVRRGFEDLFGTRLAPDVLADEERTRVRDLTTRYRTDQWTWRR